jgi:hypothetical protein
VPEIDIADETFVVVDRDALAAVFRAEDLWRSWWPGLELTVVRDRGSAGVRWSVAGDLAGTAEIWLEPWRDGVIVHWFLQATTAGERAGSDATRRDLVLSFKRRIHALKDELERDRAAGVRRDGGIGGVGRDGGEGAVPRVGASG